MKKSLVHMLHNMVVEQPEAEAIIHGELRVTYEELWAYCLSVAKFLSEHNIKKHDRIAILLENSPEYVATYYAAQAVGGIAVGLNTAAKARDLENWIRHCGAKWLFANVSHPELQKIIDAIGNDTKIVLIGESNSIQSEYIWNEIVEIVVKEININNITDSNDAATIIYTSGTTGSPKGVTLSHKNLVTNIESILSYLKLTEKDRILNVLPFYYTYGNSVLHTHLAIGGSVILENSMMYPHMILEKIELEKVTGFSGVPSTYALLLGRTNLRDYDLSSVRYMTQAGGPMPPASIKQLLEEVPHVRFFVMYGQTEASARLTYLPPDKLFDKLGSVGIPIRGVTIEIHDEQDMVVKEGVTGEICAYGDNVMLGYWNDPESTKKVIKNNCLHTGDLAYTDSDGFIYIVGRSSDMIKSGDNRISPKEIEEVITELVEVQEVAVIGVPDNILGQVIKAVIVLRPSRTLTEKIIKAHCKRYLADYKIPKYIVFANEIPKTASGKVKKYLLQNDVIDK